VSPATWNTVGVLAGAYLRDDDARGMLTHLEIPSTNDAACGRVKPGNLADVGGNLGNDDHARPTCPACARKWDRLAPLAALRDLAESADSFVGIGHALGDEDAPLRRAIEVARIVLAAHEGSATN